MFSEADIGVTLCTPRIIYLATWDIDTTSRAILVDTTWDWPEIVIETDLQVID